jgi:DNA polymerase-3 subunit gamma/tau
MVAALAAIKGQSSASEQIEESTFALNGDTLEIQTNLSKMMLPVGINADAEKVLAAKLRTNNMGIAKLKLLPGVPAAIDAPKKARVAASGSAAELAEKHPVVQEAKRLFAAEISNIIDLRD